MTYSSYLRTPSGHHWQQLIPYVISSGGDLTTEQTLAPIAEVVYFHRDYYHLLSSTYRAAIVSPGGFVAPQLFCLRLATASRWAQACLEDYGTARVQSAYSITLLDRAENPFSYIYGSGRLLLHLIAVGIILSASGRPFVTYQMGNLLCLYVPILIRFDDNNPFYGLWWNVCNNPVWQHDYLTTMTSYNCKTSGSNP